MGLELIRVDLFTGERAQASGADLGSTSEVLGVVGMIKLRLPGRGGLEEGF